MPELPDITVYVEALSDRVMNKVLGRVRIVSPFLLRSVDPPIQTVVGMTVRSVGRMGKRIVVGLDDRLFLILHLMIAGRLQWKDAGIALKPRGKDVAAFDFDDGSLILTEAGTTKRASLFLVEGEEVLQTFNRGGVNVLSARFDEVADALRHESHILKRSLTDPRLFDGIGNAYSDEILHRARMSPMARSQSLSDEEIQQLHNAMMMVLEEWTDRLRQQAAGEFPKKVTAFHKEMAVHGKFGQPCPVCETTVQRIRYKSNETNYCPHCQTDGKIYADRSLSRLLKDDWPSSIEELEEG